MRRSAKKKNWKLLQLLTKSGLPYAIALLLSGCVSVGGANNFCRIYEPVYTSEEDTEETVEAVGRNNAVYMVLCLGESML